MNDHHLKASMRIIKDNKFPILCNKCVFLLTWEMGKRTTSLECALTGAMAGPDAVSIFPHCNIHHHIRFVMERL